jgi:hypothetical protein
MAWVVIGVALAVAIVVLLVILRSRPLDRGSVSDSWVSQHRDGQS